MSIQEFWPLASAGLAKDEILKMYDVFAAWFFFYSYSYGAIGQKWQGYWNSAIICMAVVVL